MTEKKITAADKDIREFKENPYDPEKRKPEDVVRFFYIHNVPIIPVISKRGILLGVLKKDDVIAELSDIERSEKESIDTFIGKLAKKYTFEDLIPFGEIKEFIVINLFGEVQGTWSRLKLFSAIDSQSEKVDTSNELAENKDQQVLEWIIYLVLEHIPRALYAVNKKGKTIFYNSHFEELYSTLKKQDVETDVVEKMFKDSRENEIVSSPGDNTVRFYNSSLKLHYEKIPLMGNKKNLGYLFFFNEAEQKKSAFQVPGVDIRRMNLADMTDAFERALLVDALKQTDDIDEVSKKLGINKKSLRTKIEKHGIKVKG